MVLSRARTAIRHFKRCAERRPTFKRCGSYPSCAGRMMCTCICLDGPGKALVLHWCGSACALKGSYNALRTVQSYE